MSNHLDESGVSAEDIIQNLQEGIWILDREGITIYVSEPLADMLGYKVEEMIGKSGYEFMEDKQVKKAREHFSRRMNGKTERHEFRFRHKNGSIVYAFVTGSPLIDETGYVKGVIATVSDITERKKQGKKLRKNLKRYRNFFKTIKDCAFITSKEGKWIDMSDSAPEFFGYENKEELRKVKIPELYKYPEDRKEHLKVIEEKGFVKDFPVDLVKKNGETIHTLITSIAVKEQSGQVRYQGTIRDITERTEMREELEFRAKLLNSATDSIIVHDLEGNILYVNETAYSERGYKKEEMIGMNIREMDSPEFSPLIKPRVEEIMEKGRAIFETEHQRKDGSIIPLEIHSRIIDRKGEKLILTVARNIAESKRYEKRLQVLDEHAKKLSKAKDYDDIADITINFIKNVLGFERAGIGIVEDDVIRPIHTAEPIDAKDIRIDESSIIARAVRTGQSQLLSDTRNDRDYLPYYKHGGEIVQSLSELTVPIKDEDNVIGVINVESRKIDAYDEKDRRLLELFSDHVSSAFSRIERTDKLEKLVEKRTRDLRESEQRFRNIAEHSFDIIATIDSQGIIKYVSPSIKDILGYDPSEVVGRNYQNILPIYSLSNKEKDRLESALSSINRGEPVSGFQLKVIHKKRSPVTVEINATPVMEDGKVVEAEAIVRDITERIKSRELLEQQNEQLKRLNQMKDEFIAKATHELRTPLTSIKGYIDYIQSGSVGKVSEDVKDLLEVVERNTRRLQNLTDDLLDHQRISSGDIVLEKSTVKINPLINEIVEEIRPMLEEKNQEFELFIPDDLNKLKADREKIGQVLLNLLSNASNYSPENSIISVKIEDNENRVKIKISDEGIGFNEEDKEKLFEPFVNIDKPEDYSSGTGLGLSISRGIVEMHGG
ncbi:PAS domain S-box protein, partial [Candidatus Bathyarchaeota archaeon]|nr:PAS domain S-box protein [Candidatus Bathyarchaeota archaeon]